jgi:hypothetical protein
LDLFFVISALNLVSVVIDKRWISTDNRAVEASMFGDLVWSLVRTLLPSLFGFVTDDSPPCMLQGL